MRPPWAIYVPLQCSDPGLTICPPGLSQAPPPWTLRSLLSWASRQGLWVLSAFCDLSPVCNRFPRSGLHDLNLDRVPPAQRHRPAQLSDTPYPSGALCLGY